MPAAAVIAYFVRNPRKLFLIDACGAALTAFFIGIAMPALPQWFNVPVKLLYALSGIAVLFALYSAVCYAVLRSGFGPYLLAIGCANLVYCMATAAVLTTHFSQFSVYSSIYFMLEVIVIMLLVYIELMVYGELRNQSTAK